MTRSSLLGGLLVVAALVVAACTAAQNPSEKEPAKQQEAPKDSAAGATADSADSDESPDAKAVMALAESFEKAYNAHDAKAVTALFTPDAEIVSEDGEVWHGAAEIEAAFGAVFEENPKATVEVTIDSIRFVSAEVAIEEGRTTVTHQPDEPADKSKYTVVHVKQDGKWLMASARDAPDELRSSDEQLKQLSWLIGDWIDESPTAVVTSSYRWADGNAFILGQFQTKFSGRPVLSGTQRIGWDPVAKQIRSWAFDSEGGFAGGLWTRDGDRWIVKATGVTRDGKQASATNIYTFISPGRASYQSRDRIIGDEIIDDVDEVILVHPAPKPSNQ
jgi:uncharacterized protein (TIGR02246 family)